MSFLKHYKKQILAWCCVLIAIFELFCLVGFTQKSEAQLNRVVIAASVDVTTKETALPEPTATKLPLYTSLGTYKLTAYCPCEKCCGIWAVDRPVDENGKQIVYTANGTVAKQGVTIAADIEVLPFGTVVSISGQDYTVQDVGGAIQGNRIDVYFDEHTDALEFGVQYLEIFRKRG